MVTEPQTTARGAARSRVRFATVVRVTSRHGAVWRACAGCGVLAPLAPEVDRCDGCAEVNA
jgi:hypothetical protein